MQLFEKVFEKVSTFLNVAFATLMGVNGDGGPKPSIYLPVIHLTN